MAEPPTTSPSIRSSPTTATSTSAGTARPRGEKKKSRVTRYTMSTKPPSPSTTRPPRSIIDWESDGHNGGGRLLRPRRHALRHLRRRHLRLRHRTRRPGPDLLLAKVLRIDVDQPAGGKAYSVPKDNPFVGEGGSLPRRGPTACATRGGSPSTEDRPHLGRQQRPGPVGAGLSRQEGGQLRLERHGGEPSVLPQPQAGPDAVRQADRGASTTPRRGR